ncbi:zinc finger MYM-type protein 1-like, partial [Aphis craccivora]
MKSRGTKKPRKLEQHFTSNAHKAALSDYSNFVLHSNHIDNLLNKKHREYAINFSKQKEYHKAVIRILFDVSRTLARQGLAFRGDGDEKNGNFYQIVLLISRHNSTMKTWLNDSSFRRYHSTYLSHDSQNEFIHLLAKETKNNIIEEVKEAGMYSILADTTPDLSHKDQLSVCLRYVNSKAEVCERLIAIDEIVDKTGKGIASKISDVLSQNSLDLNNIAFQSYDFASSMSGKNLGTQAMLSRIVGHNIPFIPCQLSSTSTKRYFYLNNKLLEVDIKLKLRNLSMTRWTARAESIKAVWVLFEYILDVLRELINDTNIDNKTRAQALVLNEQLETENLNIIDAILLIESCIKSLKEINEDESQINNIITSAEIFTKKLDVDSNADFNKFHRQRNLPKKIDCNSSTQAIFNLQTFYRKEFKEVLDTLINESANNLRDCFKIVEPIFKILSIPIKSDIRTEDVEKACGLFPPSYEASLVTDYDAILCQINILRHKTEQENTLEKVLNVSESLKTLVPVANSLCRLSYTVPVTTASNERSFSKLKIIKNHLRTTMAANRLDDLMVLNS